MNSKISAAWQVARTDLGVRIIAPYDVKLTSGELVLCEAYVPDFGSPTGAIALSYDTTHAWRRQLGENWSSVLYEPYETYDRTLFLETLNDWGWYGPTGERPDWYTGAPWS